MRLSLILLSFFTSVFLFCGHSYGTEEYAIKTGKSCGFCHVDPSGGGELTSVGKAYRASLHPAEGVPETGSAKRIFRLIAGFVHILTGFFWFGTILYVHLVLKPRYAAHGLPKGELAVGLGSMAVMAVTGSILTFFRVSSPEMLFHTRFGILLTVKIAIFLMMVTSALIVILVIAPRFRPKKVAQVVTGKETLSPDELSQFDGKGGRPAYFSYGDRVFDATASRLWKNGVHMGRHQAGTDLTEDLKLAPHGDDKITAMPVAAMLVGKEEFSGMTVPQKTFYIMAYFNLAAVFSIVSILALWRWW
ncbi:MAG TPA: CopD family protein [Geobacteraceae bacterium]|nr:CopD family protein [Geobacteraceae bacterium]